ncbi:Crp/Fnr family transcriptional regulator [Acidithiobacillus acidisediminis]|uniref:Crp/Fnr family transcriptional regulator n=1 Tax=Acidithiobacillus TaxID=119977 RepID=UPI0020108B63|nr:Crp/Fnr family transcriptional regulator [Acidithiobacillus sp. S30A2]
MSSEVQEEDQQRLRQTPIFAAWPPPLLQELLAQSHQRVLSDGNILFTEGAKADAFYLLLSGGIHLIAAAASGDEKIIEIMQPGDLFAEAVAFLGGRYPVTAQAQSATCVLEIPLALFVQQMEARPQLMRQMLARLSMRLHFLVKELRQLSVENAEQRVVHYLLELTPEGQGRVQIELPAKKSAIATRLGLTPETLSRVLRKLQNKGLIRVQQRQLEIPDLQALQRALLTV